MSSTAKRLVLNWRGAGHGGSRKQSGDSSSGGSRLVTYGGNSGRGSADCGGAGGHELDEIAIVSSNADPCHVKYGSGGALHPTSINGPRLVPGIITSGGGRMVGERLSTSGTQLDMSPPLQTSAPTTRHKSSTESVQRALKSISRQSLLDLVSCKLGMSKSRSSSAFHQQRRYFSASHDSISATYINRAANISSAASELDLSRKQKRKDIRSRLKLPSSVALASSGEAPLLGSWRTPGSTGTNPPSSNYLNSTSSCNGTESRHGFRRRESYNPRSRSSASKWTFVFDPAGRLCYYWSMVVSFAFLYNFWVIIYRFAFQEINRDTILVWFCLDYFSDFLYLADIMFHFRTGYLEDGVLQTDATKLRHHYMNSTTFYIDCLCLLPLDFLYLSIGFNSILRSFRLVKIYRFWAFMDRTERHTNYPNLFRSTSLIHYLLVIFHWNGCLFHIIHKNNGFGSKNWVYSDSENSDVVKQYLQSYYWCTLALTTIGDLPRPRNKGEYLFVILQLLFGLMLFATVLGHVANIVTSVSAARKEFQETVFGAFNFEKFRSIFAMVLIIKPMFAAFALKESTDGPSDTFIKVVPFMQILFCR
ncbi:cyclic nucleotide-gated cation channel alpha-3-like [Agrilus planipennis]|uniref:Cyclic nucleotide-gated cation channel alpha-3-like n=1 Tax=Agrilus planipennis TaxID=224129 RepID=A0A7F5RFF9_AGRPL|nr:cyclic nucleotide-gated cation channel alpha-3-like [Agrilus planipennis]